MVLLSTRWVIVAGGCLVGELLDLLVADAGLAQRPPYAADDGVRVALVAD